MLPGKDVLKTWFRLHIEQQSILKLRMTCYERLPSGHADHYYEFMLTIVRRDLEAKASGEMAGPHSVRRWKPRWRGFPVRPARGPPRRGRVVLQPLGRRATRVQRPLRRLRRVAEWRK